MKKIYFILFFTFSSIAIFSQELKELSRNQVSENTIVITYKFHSVEKIKKVSDDEYTKPKNKKVQLIIDEFKQLENLMSINFDNATQSFTVVTKNDSEIDEKFLNYLNELLNK